jgi:type IV fimbrial biogenesis protein FimT
MNSPRRSRAAPRGVTLVELLVVIAVAAVLAGTVAPPLTRFVKSVRLTSATNDLLGGFILARSEAVKRNSRVVVCKSSDGASCASSGGWDQGWIVFHDTNNNGLHEFAEEIVQKGQPLDAGLHLAGNLNVARYVSYTARGDTKLAGGGFQAGTITVCNRSPDTSEARQIILSSTGRPRVQRAVFSSCY